MNDLLKERGFKLGAVAKAIGVHRETLGVWTDNAPIGKLIKISEFTRIPLMQVIDCFITEPGRLPPDDRTGGENN